MHAPHAETALTVDYLRFIPLAPLLGVIVNLVFGSRLGRGAVGALACGSVAISFALAMRGFAAIVGGAEGLALVDPVYGWINSGPLNIELAFRMDALSAVMCAIVTGVGFLIHVYSTGYMSHEPDHARFFAYLNLFMAAMLVLVLGDSVPVMFVGWEGVGLCSYLLIGFWYEDPAKASAGKKAFIVNRIGDAGFLLGTFVLFWGLADLGAPSLRFADINAAAPSLPHATVVAAAALLFVGATGKSAQIPLYVWLPDAMAGPTPVSALIHAATMVTAGIYMIARLNGLFVAAPEVLQVIAVIGAATAFGAATVGIAQNDIKKVLAYSTVSQLGYMFLALGAGAFGAAIFHVMTHAFFKALLFLGAGSVIHGLHEEQDIRKMGGLRHMMPTTFATFLVGTLAIAGVPLLSGFFSKDEILASVFDAGMPVLWFFGLLSAVMTAFYMTRLLVLTFFGEFRGTPEQADACHESPAVMTVPLIVLAVLAVVGGYVGVPHVLYGHNHFAAFLAPVVGHHELGLSASTELGLMFASIGAAALGILAAWRLYSDGPDADRALSEPLGGLYAAMAEAYRVDGFYDRAVIGPIRRGSEWLWRTLDTTLIDGIANGTATAAQSMGAGWRRWSTGNVQHYLLTVLIGMAVALLAISMGLGS